jgi:hypothetical protein
VSINVDFDVAAVLRDIGFNARQVVPPTHGYTGWYEPEVTFGHWTASAKGSDTAISAVLNRHYAVCVNRVAFIAVGGYKVRQGHGGRGRQAPMAEARGGRMTPARWQHWNDSAAPDDTISEPNRYGLAVCIDCTVNENIRWSQYDAWCAVQGLFLARSGLGAEHAHLHSVSTNRKIDVLYLIVDGVRQGPDDIFNRIEFWVEKIRDGEMHKPPEEDVTKMYPEIQWPSGDGYYQLKPDGGVYTFGDAVFKGSAHGHIAPGHAATHMAVTPTGQGYWILASDGGIFAFGDARFFGSVPGALPAGAKLAEPATNIAPVPDGSGYRVSCNDGGIFCFGSARFHGNAHTVDAA